MMHTGYIGTKEARALLTIVLSTSVSLTLPQDMVFQAGTAGWLAMIVSLAVGLAAWGMFSRIAKRAPGKSLVEIAEEGWGAAGRWTVGSVLGLYFLLITALVLRAFVELVIGTILPNTPSEVVMFLFMSVTVYMAYYGLETLSRLSQLIGWTLLIGLVLLLVMDWREMDFAYLYPPLGPGWGRLVEVGVVKASYFSELLLLGLMIPGIRTVTDVGRIAWNAVWVSGLLMVMMVLGYSLSFPPPAGADNPFPFYQMARLVYLGRFVQRLEAVFDLLWVIAAAVYIGAGIWGTAQSFARSWGLPVFRPLVFPVALLIYGLAALPADYPQTAALTNDYLRTWGWVMLLGLPAVVWWGAVRSNRRRREG